MGYQYDNKPEGLNQLFRFSFRNLEIEEMSKLKVRRENT